MNRPAFYVACGLLLGLPAGWIAKPTTVPGNTNPNSMNASGPNAAAMTATPFERTRTSLTRALEAMQAPAREAYADQATLSQLIDTMASLDPIGTARLIIDSGLNEPRRTDLLFDVARKWFAIEGASILDALGKAPSDGIEPFRRPVFATVANELPLDALPHIMALDDHELRTSVFANLVYAVNAEELPQILDAIAALTAEERAMVLRLYGSELALHDPERTIDWITTLTPGEQRDSANVFELLAQKNPRRALQLVESGVVPNALSVTQTALLSLARIEPEAAIAYVEATDDAEMKAGFAAEVLRGWGTLDPEAAAQWLVSLTVETSSGEYQELAGQWAKADLDAALAFVDRVPQPFRSVWNISLSWPMLEQRPERYLAWVSQFRGEPYYPQLVASWPLANHDVDAAEEFVLALEPAVRTEGLERLIQTYSNADPSRAATWVSQIPDDSARALNASQLASTWAGNEPARAIAWAQALPPGATKDAALSGLVAVLPDSMALADQISNRGTRIRALLGAGMPQDLSARLVSALERVSLDERQWTALEAGAKEAHSKVCAQCVRFPLVY